MRQFGNHRNGRVVQFKMSPNDAHRDFIPRLEFGKLRVGIVMIARNEYDERTGFGHKVGVKPGIRHRLNHTLDEHAFNRIARLVFVHDFKCNASAIGQRSRRMRQQLRGPRAHVPFAVAFPFVRVR